MRAHLIAVLLTLFLVLTFASDLRAGENSPEELEPAEIPDIAGGEGSECNSTEYSGMCMTSDSACLSPEYSFVDSSQCGVGLKCCLILFDEELYNPDAPVFELPPPIEEPDPKACVVTEWSQWSACSQQCGGGVTSRSRTISNRGSKCPPLSQNRTCNMDPCNPKPQTPTKFRQPLSNPQPPVVWIKPWYLEWWAPVLVIIAILTAVMLSLLIFVMRRRGYFAPPNRLVEAGRFPVAKDDSVVAQPFLVYGHSSH